MTIQAAPRGLRLQIGIFGKRNAGKSSLLNAIAGQDIVIVSDVPGTTADPVDKAMELSPVGPVLFIDTAGFDDDQQTIGALRVERSLKILDRCDMAILVTRQWSVEDASMLELIQARNIPVIVVLNQFQDEAPAIPEGLSAPVLTLSAKTGAGLAQLREKIIALAPEDFLSSDRMLGDLVEEHAPVLLITPIDKAAPKGRLIMPQVQAIRDALDHHAYCVVVTEDCVEQALADLKRQPCLAVTDSQIFGSVAKLIPDSIPLTSFSILLARMKGDLTTCAAGAEVIKNLQDGSKVLIAEACTHHPAEEDIGRVKLPRWIREFTGKDISFTVVSGPDFPNDLSTYDLVIHCGACTFNRRAVLTRILRCREAGVPFTNYGVAIACVKGILPRTLSPFKPGEMAK